jgi:hypothetical protein
MKQAVEMNSRARIYIPSFIKMISDVKKLIWGGRGIHRHTDSMQTA